MFRACTTRFKSQFGPQCRSRVRNTVIVLRYGRHEINRCLKNSHTRFQRVEHLIKTRVTNVIFFCPPEDHPPFWDSEIYRA
jgi:hypothetical protein